MQTSRVFVLLLVGALRGLSQQPQVEATVLDSSGRAIGRARVECGGRTALSAPDGRVAFSRIESCEATVSAAGFETRRIRLVSGAPATVELAVGHLSERVVVSATRRETTVEEAGVAASIVSAAELQQRGYPMVLDVLREIPGLHVAKFGRHGAQTQVFTRGAQRTGTLVMIDGVPVNPPGGDMNFAHLQSSSVERVEIVRGPASALFGAEASAGVIQIFTRRGEAERKVPRGSLSYERGDFQTDRWIATLAGGIAGAVDYALGAEQFHTAGEFPNDFYRNTTGTANVGVRLSAATQLRGLVRSLDSALGVPNRVAYKLIDFDAHRTTREYTSALQLHDARGPRFSQAASFGFHRTRDLFVDARRDGPYTVAALVTGASQVRLVELIDPRRLPLPPSEIPPGARLVTRTVRLNPLAAPSLSITSRANLEYQGTVSHRNGGAVFGYEYESQGGTVSGRDVDRNNHGAFVHKQQTVGGRFFLSGGVRLEQNSVFRTKLTPRGGASIRLLEATFVRFSAGRGITEPSLLQSFARDSTFVGNPSLRPEKTTSCEAGVVQELFQKRLRVEAAAFHNSFRDLIVFVSLPLPAPATWQNVEASRARGLEFSAQSRLPKHVSVSGSYTFLRSRITRSNAPNSPVTGVGQELLRRPRHSAAVSLSVAPPRWSFQAGAVLMGERQDMDGAGFGLTRNPGYQAVYAGGSFRLSAHSELLLRADNLLNSRYQEVLGYSSLSRALRGGLRVQW